MHRLTLLVALKYHEFQEEFIRFPTYCTLFEKIKLKVELNQQLDIKEKTKSLKI